MSERNCFPIVILNGRPAAGKSEVIDYLKSTPIEERIERFHIGEFEEYDDFPILWERFMDDDILSANGRDRMWTDKKYYFKENYAWNFFIEKLCQNYAVQMAKEPAYHDKTTAVFEFARGGENGFGEAYSFLSDEVLSKAGIVYIEVSYEESCRKNKRRARPGEEDSILHHSLPDDKMSFYYEKNDWYDVAPDRNGFIDVRGKKVPYAVFPNEPEVTDRPEALGKTLEETLGKLWELRNKG